MGCLVDWQRNGLLLVSVSLVVAYLSWLRDVVSVHARATHMRLLLVNDVGGVKC